MKKIVLLVCWSFSDVIVQERHYAAHLSHPRAFPYLPGKIILSADLSVLLKWITWTYKRAVNDEKFRAGYYANRVSTWKRRCVVKVKRSYNARHRFKIDYGACSRCHKLSAYYSWWNTFLCVRFWLDMKTKIAVLRLFKNSWQIFSS